MRGFDFADDEMQVQAEMNVTPFIDVMLVLLIIFMVVAPLSAVNSVVELPESNAQQTKRPMEPLVLVLEPNGVLTHNRIVIGTHRLRALVQAHQTRSEDPTVFLEADAATSYEQVMHTLNQLRSLGQTQVALVGKEAGGA